jgi:hypothetical protein
VETKDEERFLINTQYEKFIGHFQEVELKKYLYKDLFKIGNEALGYFALKIRDAGQKNVMDSIEILSALKDPENIVNKNIDTIIRDGYVIMEDMNPGNLFITNDKEIERRIAEVIKKEKFI